jgi:hypothetical protein
MEKKFRILLLSERVVSMSLIPKEVALGYTADRVTFLPIGSQNWSKNIYTVLVVLTYI